MPTTAYLSVDNRMQNYSCQLSKLQRSADLVKLRFNLLSRYCRDDHKFRCHARERGAVKLEGNRFAVFIDTPRNAISTSTTKETVALSKNNASYLIVHALRDKPQPPTNCHPLTCVHPAVFCCALLCQSPFVFWLAAQSAVSRDYRTAAALVDAGTMPKLRRSRRRRRLLLRWRRRQLWRVTQPTLRMGRRRGRRCGLVRLYSGW